MTHFLPYYNLAEGSYPAAKGVQLSKTTLYYIFDESLCILVKVGTKSWAALGKAVLRQSQNSGAYDLGGGLGELSVQRCQGSAQSSRAEVQMWTDGAIDPWLNAYLSDPWHGLGRSTVLCCSFRLTCARFTLLLVVTLPLLFGVTFVFVCQTLIQARYYYSSALQLVMHVAVLSQ